MNDENEFGQGSKAKALDSKMKKLWTPK